MITLQPKASSACSKRRSAPPSGRVTRRLAPTSSASSRSSTTAPGSASTPSSGTSPHSKPEPNCSKTSPLQRKHPLSKIRGELQGLQPPGGVLELAEQVRDLFEGDQVGHTSLLRCEAGEQLARDDD